MDGASLPSCRPSMRNCRRPFSEVGPCPGPLGPFHSTPGARSGTCPWVSCLGTPPSLYCSLTREEVRCWDRNNPAKVLASVVPLAPLSALGL